MSNQIIPLTTDPDQSFQISLSVGNSTIRLNLRIRYNEMANYWTMQIADSTGKILISSLPLLTGTWPAANILAQYQYLNIGSAYVINVSNNLKTDYPDATSLGTDFQLLWGDQTS